MPNEQGPLRIVDDGSTPLPKRIDNLETWAREQDSRLDVLERDKAYILGIAAAVGVLVGLTLGILTIWASWGPK